MDTNSVRETMETIEIPAALGERSRAGIRQAAEEQHAARRLQKKRRSRRVLAAASLAGALVLAAVFIQQSPVWAAIARALQFVPGIGIVQEESASRYVLKEPIRLTTEPGSLTITGGVADERETYFTMFGLKSPMPEHVTLTNEQGDSYELARSSATWGGDTWTSVYWHNGPIETEGKIVLTIPLNSPLEVDVELAAADSVASYEELGPTQIHHGVWITAAHQRIGEQLRVTLLTPPGSDFRVNNYGISGFYDTTPVLQVTASGGELVEITRDMGVSGPEREFYIPLTNGESPYELTLPEVLIDYPMDTVKVKVPTDTQEQLNREVELAGFPFTLTGTERIGDRLRIYVDVHYDPDAPVSLLQIGKIGSHMARYDETTGAFLYLEFDAPPGKRETTLELERPVAVVRGPWVFELQP